MSKSDPKLENFLTEPEMEKFFGMKKEQLGTLRREKALPFVKISANSRLYFEADVIQWLISKRMKGGVEMP